MFNVFLSSKISAQDITANLKADSTHILIGDFLNVKVTVRYPTGFTIVFPATRDSFGNMELVKASRIDTSDNGNFKVLSQIYSVSAYDSGKYQLGPEKILYRNKSGVLDSVLSDSISIEVTTMAVDTAKAIKPIKAPVEVPYSLKEFLPFIAVGIILVAIIIAVIYFIRRWRKTRKTVVKERPKPKDPPHIWARSELKRLDEEKLWQKDEIKKYYSRLTEILRLYLEYRYNWLALESTTEEITGNIHSYNIPAEAADHLMMVLRNADLVKFAKMIPMPDINIRVMDNAFKFIDLTEEKVVKADEK
ncbi:MAG: hypothetical protein ABIO23_07705 [Chitinophagales bacterium]